MDPSQIMKLLKTGCESFVQCVFKFSVESVFIPRIKTSPTPTPPPFLFGYMDKSFHWILLSCKNKNDPQMFKNYSGTIQCSICQSSQDSQSGRRLESMKKNPSLHKLSCCRRSWGKACSCDILITERKSLQA